MAEPLVIGTPRATEPEPEPPAPYEHQDLLDLIESRVHDRWTERYDKAFMTEIYDRWVVFVNFINTLGPDTITKNTEKVAQLYDQVWDLVNGTICKVLYETVRSVISYEHPDYSDVKQRSHQFCPFYSACYESGSLDHSRYNMIYIDIRLEGSANLYELMYDMPSGMLTKIAVVKDTWKGVDDN